MHSTWRKNTCKVIQTLTTTLIGSYGPLTSVHSTWRKNTCKVIQTLTTTLIDPYGPLTPFMHSTWGRNTRKVTQPLTNIPIGLLVQIPGCILTQSPFYTIGMCKYQHHCEPDVHSLLVSPQISGPGIYFPTHHTIPIIFALLWSSVFF